MDDKTFKNFLEVLKNNDAAAKIFNFWSNMLSRCPVAKQLGFINHHIIERSVAMAITSVMAQVLEHSKVTQTFPTWDIVVSLTEPVNYIYKIDDQFKGESIATFPAFIKPKSSLILPN